MITFEVEGLDESIDKIDRLSSRNLEIIKRGLMGIGQDIMVIMKYLTPYQTGSLRRSISVKFNESELSADIASSANYADMVNSGTMPHIIAPGAKGFLSWKASGPYRRGKGWVFTRRPVSHPGNKGQHYVEGSINQYNEESAQAAMADAYKLYSDGVVTDDTGEET